MGTPANIIIQYENNFFLLPKGKDEILLFCGSDGYPFEFDGIIYYLVKAYQNLKSKEKYSKDTNMLSPEDFASELIRISFYKSRDICRIYPATLLMYQQYDKQCYFVDCAYKYICAFRKDKEDENYDMTLTVNTSDTEINKTMEEWNSVCGIASQLVSHRHEKVINIDEETPCFKCLVRSACINKDDDNVTFARNPCDELRLYKKEKIKELRDKLPEWSIQLVFTDDY